MGNEIRWLLGTVSAAAVLTAGASAQAATTGFNGAYDVSNWTITRSSTSVGGSVDVSGAPNSITLNEPNSGEGGWVEFSILTKQTGVYSFDWSFGGEDVGFGAAEINVDGAITQLATNNVATGSFSQTISADTLFGFRSSSTDGFFGLTTFTVSNFSAPAAVPAPAALPLLLTAFGGLMVASRRRLPTA
jgi:hypothetical protein